MMSFSFTAIITATTLLFAFIGQQRVESVSDGFNPSVPSKLHFYEPIKPLAKDEPFILMRLIFNSGNPPNETTFCSEQDYVQIIAAFPLNMQGRRNLRSADDKLDIVQESTPTRELQQYPPFCANACAGYTPGTCRATRCVGYRRSLAGTSFTFPNQQVEFICKNTMSRLHMNIDHLIMFNKVSNTCKTYLVATKRETYCAVC